jgi:hypothetical protein
MEERTTSKSVVGVDSHFSFFCKLIRRNVMLIEPIIEKQHCRILDFKLGTIDGISLFFLF